MPPTDLSRRRGLRNFRATELGLTRPNLNELSSATSGAFSDVGSFYAEQLASNPDDLVLAAKGGGLEIYEKVLTDDQVYSNFQQRRMALISKEVDVQPGAKDKQSVAAADFIRDMISGLNFDRICDKMAYGIFYGYGIGECLWARDGRHWTLDNVKVRKAKRFKYSKTGDLMLLTTAKPQGEKMEDRKFWTFESGSDHDDNPYGVGLAAHCYWPSFFKRNGVRYWVLALEKFGAPTTVGRYPANATKEEKTKLLEAAASYTAVSGLTIPDTMTLELLGADGKFGGNHDKLVELMNGSISKVIVGQTMTTDNGSSNSQAQVHENVREDLTKADVDLQCGSFAAGPLKWLMEWNYPKAAAPLVTRNTEEPEDLDSQVERDSKLYAMGWEPTDEHILDKYGDGYVRRTMNDSGTAAATGQGAQNNPDAANFNALDLSARAAANDAVGRFLESEDHADALEDELGQLITAIEAQLTAARDPQEAKKRLIKLMGVPTDDPFAQRLARASFNARLHGRGIPEKDEQL